MNGVLIKDKEVDTVVSAVHMHWVLELNGLGFGVHTKHIYSDNGTLQFNSIHFKHRRGIQ